MKINPALGFLLLSSVLISGCDFGPKSGRGFAFPTGNADKGKSAFVDMKCYECHRVDGVVDLPAPVASPEKIVVLGGKVARLRSYGDLVTSVIHPSYALSENYTDPARKGRTDSPMKPVNDKMTVQQMLDIVTFLHPRYKELEPLYSQNYKVP